LGFDLLEWVLGIIIGLGAIIIYDVIIPYRISVVGVNVDARDVVACLVVVCMSILTSMGKVSGEVFSSTVGVIVGYYFGKGISVLKRADEES